MQVALVFIAALRTIFPGAVVMFVAIAPPRPRVRDVELCEHVAGREGHLGDVGGVPGGEDNAAVERGLAELADDLGELVDALAGVIGAVVDVLGAEVAPLKAVDGAQVALLAVPEPRPVQERPRPVAVPDPHALRRQVQRRRPAPDEPQQLRHHRFQKYPLRRQKRQHSPQRFRVVQRELERPRRKDRVRARSRPGWRSGAVSIVFPLMIDTSICCGNRPI